LIVDHLAAAAALTHSASELRTAVEARLRSLIRA
jgi:hypothetical protein